MCICCVIILLNLIKLVFIFYQSSFDPWSSVNVLHENKEGTSTCFCVMPISIKFS